MSPHLAGDILGGGECGINERMKWSGTRQCSSSDHGVSELYYTFTTIKNPHLLSEG